MAGAYNAFKLNVDDVTAHPNVSSLALHHTAPYCDVITTFQRPSDVDLETETARALEVAWTSFTPPGA